MENILKNRRREEILNIINNENIEKQDQLVFKLRRRGINVTQATLSRDLREMHIIRKPSGNKQYRYIRITQEDVGKRCQNVFKDAVIRIFIQDYFISVKTMNGMAAAVGELIDRLDDKRIAGTVASNNNVLVLCRSNEYAKHVFKELNDLRL
ncbi:arginine repressor [Eubacterium multiforme]|uniref:Arginine repressor n=1 Tax=Eubacterium multiforme TaxID=83339 RepID=A0ABT9UVS0_9FIRM|nr:arginine regulator [Eubacterium multiforme]MDQ0150371.1 transcriptional regulator of arginine metabolism [Eubacterium multiforme]